MSRKTPADLERILVEDRKKKLAALVDAAKAARKDLQEWVDTCEHANLTPNDFGWFNTTPTKEVIAQLDKAIREWEGKP